MPAEVLYWALCCLLIIIVLYGLLELHYFLRMLLCVLLARFVKRRCHILETTTVNGICLTTDVDTLLYHMNNARYLRELDFARVDFYERTSLYRTITALGGSVFQGAATIRYRRFIRPFRRFKIISRIVYWDEQSLFMEHRFVCPADQFVHCIAVCRQRVINVSMDAVMTALLTPRASTTPLQASRHTLSSTISLQQNGVQTTSLEQLENGHAVPQTLNSKLKPDLSPELGKWIEYNDLSSKSLRCGS